MPVKDLIAAADFCSYHKVEISVIHSLHGSGLIHLIETGQEYYIPEDELPELEKLVRLYELGINVEGIETITHLLHQLRLLQQRIQLLSDQVKAIS